MRLVENDMKVYERADIIKPEDGHVPSGSGRKSVQGGKDQGCRAQRDWAGRNVQRGTECGGNPSGGAEGKVLTGGSNKALKGSARGDSRSGGMGAAEDYVLTSRYWHLCSDSLPSGLLFKDDSDYIAGMNGIALALLDVNVKIYCFTLMSNHIHVLLSGTMKEVFAFFEHWKKRVAQHVFRGWAISPVRGLKCSLFDIPDTERFMATVNYIMRNCVSASIGDPYSYPWCSCRVYFNRGIYPAMARRAGEMGKDEARRLFHTHEKIPDNYMIAPSGVILPESYVCAEKVENLYRKPISLFWGFVNKNVEEASVQFSGNVGSGGEDDTSLLKELQPEFLKRGVRGFDEMDEGKKRLMVPVMRCRYRCSFKQISRLTRLDVKTVRLLGGWD